MNQKAFMQGFDALAFGAFRSAGVADAGFYIGVDGLEHPCTVLVDKDVQQFTDDDPAPIATTIDRITLQLSEVTPRATAVVRVEATGQRFKLVQKLRGDSSTEQWEVARV